MRKRNNSRMSGTLIQNQLIMNITVNHIFVRSGLFFRRAFLLALLLVAFFCSALHSANAAAPLRFDVFEPRLLETPEGIVLGLSCSVDDEDALRALLKDGAVLNLSVHVSIEGTRSWWLNKDIAEETFTSIIRHNPLTREFTVALPGAGDDFVIKDKNLTRLLHSSWRKLSFIILPEAHVRELDKDREYTVTVGIDLQHAEVPPWLENSLGVWSSEVIPQQVKKLTLTFPVTLSLP